MAKCTVTLNVALLGKAYVGKSIKISDVVARNDGTYWTTTEVGTIPLTNSPLATVSLDQDTAYQFVLPDGSKSVRLVPPLVARNFSQLEVLVSSPKSPGTYVVDAYTYVLEPGEELPADAVPGQTYFEIDTNVFGQIGA